MQLSPRYGADPIIVLDGAASAAGVPLARQQRRLVEHLAQLDEDDWNHPSRCAGWSTRDVIVHLDTATAFWVLSATHGRYGTPTQFLATFDPVASPAQMVAASTASSSQALESFAANSAALADLLSSLDEAGWAASAEAPPGHVSIGTMAHHALWDSWVHERDVLVPLGIEPAVEVDEVTACLRYAAALSPAFAVTQGGHVRGILQVEATHPRVSVRVDIGSEVRITDADAGTAAADVTLEGRAVDLVEALSMRGPLAADVTPGFEWMLQGLATIFDQSPG